MAKKSKRAAKQAYKRARGFGRYRAIRLVSNLAFFLGLGFVLWRVSQNSGAGAELVAVGVIVTIAAVARIASFAWLHKQPHSRGPENDERRRLVGELSSHGTLWIGQQIFFVGWMWLIVNYAMGDDPTIAPLITWTIVLGLGCASLVLAVPAGIGALVLAAFTTPWDSTPLTVGFSAVWAAWAAIYFFNKLLSGDSRTAWERREDARIDRRHDIATMRQNSSSVAQREANLARREAEFRLKQKEAELDALRRKTGQ